MNQLINPTTTDIRPRIPFNTLQTGDKYTHDINVHSIFKRTEDSITIKRHDDWLVIVNVGDYGRGRMVVKV